MIQYVNIARDSHVRTQTHCKCHLDIECYDDLELEDLDWREVLDLQGDENVDVSIRETAIF